MNEIVKFIFLFLVGTTLLNLVIAIAARIKTGLKNYNTLIIYWCFLFITYFAVASLSTSQNEIAFAYFFQFFPSLLLVKTLCDSRQIRINYTLYGMTYVIGAVVSAALILQGNVSFTLSLLPVTFATTLPFYHPIWNTLVKERHEANWIEKGMGIMFITGVINHFNYAFFRMIPGTEWWGWSVSIAQYQCVSVFLPLLINHKQTKDEKQRLQEAIDHLSGKTSGYDGEIKDHYQRLNELTRELKSSNQSLEQERQMNEILIRTVSHDLANPLMVINSYLELIRTGRTTDTAVTMEKIKKNSNSALEMINRIKNAVVTRNLSHMAKIEHVNLKHSLNSLHELFDSRLKEKQLELEINNKLPTDVRVKADGKTLVEHVFANILSNAIKFSYPGSKVIIEVTEGSGNTVKINFRDFGIGFSPVNSIPLQGTNGETGSGMGLVLMKYFLTKFDGDFSINSAEDGKGTIVSLGLKKV